jgi:hypothetical protein
VLVLVLRMIQVVDQAAAAETAGHLLELAGLSAEWRMVQVVDQLSAE